MLRSRLAWFALLIVVACCAWILWPSGSVVTAAAARDVPHLEDHRIRFSNEFAKRAGVVVAPCASGDIAPIVSVTGTVAFDPQRVAAIGSRISGRVHRVLRAAGDEVRAGDAIVEIESAELGQAQAAILSARANAEVADANDKRHIDLSREGIASARSAELARAEATSARAELRAAEQRLQSLGGDATSDVGLLVLRSPIAGKVIELNVVRGQFVEPTLTTARIADLSRVWIELDVFERELGHVQASDPVEISPQTNRSLILAGSVARVGDVINADTRSAPVRVVVENGDRSLRPGQSVIAKIKTKRTGRTLVVPLDATTMVDGKATVFVSPEDTSVEPREVVLGPRDATHVVVVSGLEEGERIVVAGVFALKAEMFR